MARACSVKKKLDKSFKILFKFIQDLELCMMYVLYVAILLRVCKG